MYTPLPSRVATVSRQAARAAGVAGMKQSKTMVRRKKDRSP